MSPWHPKVPVPSVNDIHSGPQRGAAGPSLGLWGFLTLDWAPSAGGDVALESDVAYSHQRGPYLWCGTADGMKRLVLHSGSRDGTSQCLSMYCKSAVSEAKGDRGAHCH